ncbi:hypothetical protein Q5P01_000496 [Channa striata]|uniref:LRAT domain-containing protein n=1 Tax=Channa striata TaxID=64152 RepID=A0AA88LMP0_CHASR|nr:hypothetical protein Q5P01_000496 [Channa striata]
MKILILAAVFLQLVMRSDADEVYHFGDIIAFPHQKKCRCETALYKHYAVYVGREQIPGKAPYQDIFHLTGHTKFQATCVFGKLSQQPYHYKENYLDGRPGYTVGDHATIRRRIIAMRRMCRRYDLFRNNCEHLATYVRYGRRRSVQRGTVGGFVWRWYRKLRRLLGKRSLFRYFFSKTPNYENISCKELCRRKFG